MNVLMILLLVLIISCAVCVAFTKNLLVAAVVFMTQSLLLSLVCSLRISASRRRPSVRGSTVCCYLSRSRQSMQSTGSTAAGRRRRIYE